MVEKLIENLEWRLVNHMNTQKDSLSEELWEIEFHEGGAVSLDGVNSLVLSGDNGRLEVNTDELLIRLQPSTKRLRDITE